MTTVAILPPENASPPRAAPTASVAPVINLSQLFIPPADPNPPRAAVRKFSRMGRLKLSASKILASALSCAYSYIAEKYFGGAAVLTAALRFDAS